MNLKSISISAVIYFGMAYWVWGDKGLAMSIALLLFLTFSFGFYVFVKEAIFNAPNPDQAVYATILAVVFVLYVLSLALSGPSYGGDDPAYCGRC